MKNRGEIVEEIKRRARFTLSQSESYSSYRANMNFLRGLLWVLNYPTSITKSNLNSILKQVGNP